MKTNQAILVVLALMLVGFAACDHREHVITRRVTKHYHYHAK